jgi:hypothetical protein
VREGREEFDDGAGDFLIRGGGGAGFQYREGAGITVWVCFINIGALYKTEAATQRKKNRRCTQI